LGTDSDFYQGGFKRKKFSNYGVKMQRKTGSLIIFVVKLAGIFSCPFCTEAQESKDIHPLLADKN
jgi:hypothetical protein